MSSLPWFKRSRQISISLKLEGSYWRYPVFFSLRSKFYQDLRRDVYDKRLGREKNDAGSKLYANLVPRVPLPFSFEKVLLWRRTRKEPRSEARFVPLLFLYSQSLGRKKKNWSPEIQRSSQLRWRVTFVSERELSNKQSSDKKEGKGLGERESCCSVWKEANHWVTWPRVVPDIQARN